MTFEFNDPFDKWPDHLKGMIPEDVKRRVVENQILQRSISELSSLFAALEQDVNELFKFGKTNQNEQAWRRAAYRAVFAWIEGVVYQMKQVAFNTQGGFYQAEFSRAEIAYLLEESYYLEEKGKVKTRNNNFVEIDKNLRFAFSKLAEGFNISTKLDIGGQGWQEFKKAIQIRNRLTHPKAVKQLVVSDEEMETLAITIKWFNEQSARLIHHVQATTPPTLAKIRNEGQAAQQKLVDGAMAVLARASKVESAIKIIDEVIAAEEASEETRSKLSTAKSGLEELKVSIVKDMGNLK